MEKKTSQTVMSMFFIAFSIFLGAWIVTHVESLIWYWALGLSFGYTMQRSAICFTSAISTPIIIGDTSIFRAILIGILTASVGITVIKYLSNGNLNILGVSAISLPLILGAFMFGIGMVVAGCCVSGVFIRLAEGYTIHIITIIFIIGGYIIANKHYEMVWAPFIIDSPVIFLPEKFGWGFGVLIHITIFLLLYTAAIKWEKRQLGEISDNKQNQINKQSIYKKVISSPFTYLVGGILLGILNIIHYIALKSGWSVTGGFFWLTESSSSFLNGPNIRNIGLFVGALIAVLASTKFKIKKIRSKKQVLSSILGGILMGYGAGIAGGCNISAFFTAAASLSLSAWVFMIFLFVGAFTGIKLLEGFLLTK